MKTIILLLLTTLVTVSCNVGPQPIEYGEDGCQFCKMTIVERQHASQLVTSKGKVYKFDAIECMINYMEDNKETQYSHILVADFRVPGTLIDAKKVTFIISENIPSPMNGNLSALGDLQQAVELQKEKSGELYNWKELVEHLKK